MKKGLSITVTGDQGSGKSLFANSANTILHADKMITIDMDGYISAHYLTHKILNLKKLETTYLVIFETIISDRAYIMANNVVNEIRKIEKGLTLHAIFILQNSITERYEFKLQ